MEAKPTILTNLQRGNITQEDPIRHQKTIHELAAQGELYQIHGADILDANNMTPLFWAAGYGQNSTVELLLRSGANPNHRANGGTTALMFAASKGYFQVVKTLIADGANLDDVDEFGNSALMYAAHQDHALVIKELLRNGADLGKVNIYRQTAYSIALAKGNRSAQATIETQLVSIFNSR